MIESGTTNRSHSRWLQAGVVLLAVAVLPLGLAYAKESNHDAIGRRLRAAVQAGELTAEQAKAMLDTLRKTDGDRKTDVARKDQQSDRARADAHMKEIWAKLQASVKAGKISEQDAHRKMGEIKKNIHAKLEGNRGRGDDREGHAREYLTKVRKALEAAVKAGKISKEDAARKMAGAEKAIREKMATGRGQDQAKQGEGADQVRQHLMNVRKELGEAVKAGKISREDAAKKMAAAERAARERMAGGRGEHGAKRISAEDLERAGIDIRKAVASGRITAEQGRAKMQAMRKMAGQQTERGADRRATKPPARVDWEAIKARIEGAVKRGDLTREQADAKYKEIKERMGQQRQRKPATRERKPATRER